MRIASSIATKNSLYKFIHTFPCLPAPLRPNPSIRFRLIEASKPSLTNSPSPLKSSAWANLLLQYLKPGGLRIHFPMILCFGIELGYKGPSDAFTLSDNLTLALKDPAIIEKKLQEDLVSGCVTQLEESPTPSYICSPLGLVIKHDSGWQKIHHLSHPCEESVNDQIPDGIGKLRYTRFQEVLQLVIRAGRHCIILERDVNDAFRNIPVAPQHQ